MTEIDVFVKACEKFRKRHPEGHNTSGYGCGCELCRAVEKVTGRNPMANDETLAWAEEDSRRRVESIKKINRARCGKF
jgi:hypothetical protein